MYGGVIHFNSCHGANLTHHETISMQFNQQQKINKYLLKPTKFMDKVQNIKKIIFATDFVNLVENINNIIINNFITIFKLKAI